jgi:hypothetical protein
LPPEQLAPQFDPLFIGMALVWGYAFALIGGLGIQYVARVAQFFPIVPILLLLIGSVQALLYGNFDGFRQTQQQAGVDVTDPINLATLFVIQMVVGFFGTAGAVGADFCSNNRNEDDVKWGGVFGIWLAVIFTAGLALITVAGAFGSAGGEFGNMYCATAMPWKSSTPATVSRTGSPKPCSSSSPLAQWHRRVFVRSSSATVSPRCWHARKHDCRSPWLALRSAFSSP